VAGGRLGAAGVVLDRIAVPDAGGLAADPDSVPVGLVRSLAPDAEAPPALLIDLAEPSRDAVLTAALINP